MKESPKGMAKTAQIANLNDIKVFSIEIQKYIHGACANMANLLKMLDLKLKEIKIVDLKISSLLTGKAAKKSYQKQDSAAKKKAKILKKALAKEKLIIEKVMKEIQEKQKEIMKVIKTFDSKILKGKGQANMKNLLTSLNNKLKSFMHLPYFKVAYHNFIGSVIASSRNMSPKQLKDYHGTAQILIKKYWKNYLNKAEEEYNKKHKKEMKDKKGKKSSPIEENNKKHKKEMKDKKGKKSSPIKKIK
jgi:hypothetical protein